MASDVANYNEFSIDMPPGNDNGGATAARAGADVIPPDEPDQKAGRRRVEDEPPVGQIAQETPPTVKRYVNPSCTKSHKGEDDETLNHLSAVTILSVE
jgi:hypothetical protein